MAAATSSKAALPARSPMPLMVHSTCPGFNRGQSVGYGHAKVVVTMG